MENSLILLSNDEFYRYVLHYICSEEKLSTKVNQFNYLSESTLKPYEFRRRGEKELKIKICATEDTSFQFDFQEKTIDFQLETIMKDNSIQKIIVPSKKCCGQIEEIILKRLTLKSDNKKTLIEFVDVAKQFCEDQIKKSKKSSNKTVKVFLWRKEYWNLLFKSPKRPIETLYLKEGQKESLLKKVEDFYSPETREEYLSFGIPYKCVFMLYGVPGSGKTSTINTIASYFDCDVYVIPISKELTDYMLIDAISFLEEKEEKKRIIVIEDIDSIFTDRKKGDDIHNSLSLQALLNCFDGFSCVEGTLLFITANKPEVLDYALLRSCRVDYRFELGYADKYQTKSIFEMVLPEQKEEFNQFYESIKSKEFTTAMLQEFLFFNRKCDTILDKIDTFFDIIKKNKPENFETDQKETQNIYM
tara:strand:+ start:204 stop:1454 length:1251 start_codon:yes stop_codon:yes gene_type:complete